MALAMPFIAVAQEMGPAVSQFVNFDGARGTIKLVHARVIDGAGSLPKQDQTIEIQHGYITDIRPSTNDDVPDGKLMLDMKGHSVLPGLIGMHDHLFYVARPENDAEHHIPIPIPIPMLPPQMTYSAPLLYLAGGVTTIRTTGSLDPYTDLNLKKEIDANRLAGPHMDVTAPYLQGTGNPFMQMHTLTNADDARFIVNYWASQGANSFKAYTHISRDELKAAVDAAHARGLKVTGHLCSITYPEAAELGIDNLEHGFFVNTQLDPDKKADECPARGANRTMRAMDPDGPEATALIKLLVDKKVAITSTLPVFEGYALGGPPLQQRMLDAMTPQAREAYLLIRSAENSSSRESNDDALRRFKRG